MLYIGLMAPGWVMHSLPRRELSAPELVEACCLKREVSPVDSKEFVGFLERDISRLSFSFSFSLSLSLPPFCSPG